MRRIACALLLAACGKKAPPPGAAVEASAPPVASSERPCQVAVATGTADVGVSPGPGGVDAKDPTKLAVALSGNRIALVTVPAAGSESCEGGRPAVHREIEDPRVEDDVVLYDEETTPLRPGEDGCEQAGPPQHAWHAVDTRTKKEWVFRGDVTVTVSAREIVAKKAGCDEIRYSR